MQTFIPQPLCPGDEVRLVSPSGAIDPAYVDAARQRLSGWGYRPVEGRYARSAHGRFAGTDNERAADLQAALDDPHVRCILCTRGGYGLMRILDRLDFRALLRQPKWVVGFSDITALHAVLSRQGVVSVHGGMARALAELPPEASSVVLLRDVLAGQRPSYVLPPHAANRPGTAEGLLIGGNLSLLAALRGTPYEPPYAGNILFIEDVGESPYRIDRLLRTLRLGGVFRQLAGLVVGSFTGTDPDPLMPVTLEQQILDAVDNPSLPVCFGFPAGHVDDNRPLLLGHHACLEVTDAGVMLEFR